MFYLVWYVVLLVRMWCRVSFQRFTPVLCWFLLWWERDNINTNGSTCCFVHLDEIKLHFQRMFWSGICQRRLISSKSSQNSSINRPFFASQIQVFSINRKAWVKSSNETSEPQFTCISLFCFKYTKYYSYATIMLSFRLCINFKSIHYLVECNIFLFFSLTHLILHSSLNIMQDQKEQKCPSHNLRFEYKHCWYLLVIQ